MKKLIAAALCLVLILSAGPAALAAPDKTAPGTAPSSAPYMTERLKQITLKVKETLGIGDSFTSFNGNLNEMSSGSLWYLSWTSDKEQIHVSANENGTIVSYSHYLSGEASKPYSRIPRFPTLSLDDAKPIANAFLAKVLDQKTATVDLSGTSALDYSGNATYYLSGLLKLNGIETPIHLSITVTAEGSQVTDYYRGDTGQDYAGAQNPASASDKAAAAEALKGTLNMKLTYALPGDGTHTARLQYTPNPGGYFVVDAVTGKVVDLSKENNGSDIYYSQSKGTMADGMGGSSRPAITQVEQATIDQLQGVLPQSALESAVRAYPELGLGDFKVQNVNYYTYKDDNKQTQVTANMMFVFAPKDDAAQYRAVTLDARTGKLLSVGGSIRLYGDAKTAQAEHTYSAEQTQTAASSFAAKVLPDEMKSAVLSAETTSAVVNQPAGSSVRTYTFYRTQDGVPFPENFISVGVDADTGYIMNFNYSWYKYDVTFVSKANAITADAAAGKYADGAGTVLKYVQVPTSLQPSGLLLAYTTADTSVLGVNALTGELLKSTVIPEVTTLKYDDISGNPNAAMIEKLAFYGVGFPGSSFKPDAQLIQEDALVLIESTNGRKAVPLMSTSDTDDVYNTAYSMGILTPEEKNPSKPITRAEFVKYLVNALGYKEVAVLPGIFKPGFTDDASIPEGLAGYIALGKGFGLITADQNGNCRAGETASRVQAAVMLYNCMSRK